MWNSTSLLHIVGHEKKSAMYFKNYSTITRICQLICSKIPKENNSLFSEAWFVNLFTINYWFFFNHFFQVSPREIYGGFARNCIARTVDDDNDETVYTVTDENGCSTDPDIFRDWDYDPVAGHLTAIFDAFKFPDGNTIKFKCNIRVCFGQCQPQNCAGINAYGRKKRESETEIAGEVYTGA